MTMNGENPTDDLLELKRLFEEDMQSLVELTFPHSPVKERHVRQASVIVRRWLCDNELQNLTSKLRAAVTFPVLNDHYIIKNVIDDPNIDYYLSAGVKFSGTPILAIFHSNADEIPTWLSQLAALGIKEEKFGRVMNRPTLYFDGEVFRLDEVLRFACNKLGGAHFDTSRNERNKKLDAAADYVTFGPPEATLPEGRPGTIHMSVEKTGLEILSGISITVIAAAAMLVNIRFNGTPLINFSS